MKINRQSLVSVIQTVAPLVKGRTTIPALSNVMIWSDDAGFHAMATNLDAFIQVSIPAEGPHLTACGVSAGSLLAVCGQGPEFAELNLADNQRLTVQCGSTSKLSTASGGEFPLFPSEKAKALGVNCQDLSECIKAVSWSASDDPNRAIASQSVWVKLDPKAKAIVTCANNGKIMAHCHKPEIVPEADFMFPANQSKMIWEALEQDGATVSLSDSWIVVQSDACKVAVKLCEGKYMAIDYVLNAAREKLGKLDVVCRVDLQNALSTISTLSPDAFAPVSIKTDKLGIHLEHRGKINEFTGTVASKLGDGEFWVDASILRTILKNATEDTFELSINKTSLKLNGGDCSYCLALVNPAAMK